MLKPLQDLVPGIQGDSMAAPSSSVNDSSPSLAGHQSDDEDTPGDDSPMTTTMTTAQGIEAQMALIMGYDKMLTRSGNNASQTPNLFGSLNPSDLASNSNIFGEGMGSGNFFLDGLTESMFKTPFNSSFTSNMSEVRIDETILKTMNGSTPYAGSRAGAGFKGQPFTSFMTIPQPLPVENFLDLESHLMAIFFTYVTHVVPMIREDLFLADYYPINRHPAALTNAIYGTATMFSQHPKIYTKFKTPFKAAQYYMELAEKNLVSVSDPLASMQTMVLIGLWDFGCFFGMQAYQWIGQGCRESHKLNLRRAKEFCEYRFSVWRGPIDEPTSEQYGVRYRTWATLFLMDTFATMVSGLPLAISEEDYAYVLVNWEKRLKELIRDDRKRKFRAKNDMDEWEPPTPDVDSIIHEKPRDGEWKKMFANVPGDSIFDIPSVTRMHPVGFRKKVNPYTRFGVDIPLAVLDVPRHMMSSEFDQYYLLHLSFIVRRICRLTQRREVDANFTDSAAAISILPSTADILQLHDSLIQFYFNLPESERAFKSFDEISSQVSLPPPSANSHPPWVYRCTGVQLQLTFFCALALLHDPALSDGKRAFRIGVNPATNGGKRVNSLELLVMSQHAQVHIVRCIYSAYGGAYRPAPPRAANTAANAVAAAMTESLSEDLVHPTTSTTAPRAPQKSPKIAMATSGLPSNFDSASLTTPTASHLDHMLSLWDSSPFIETPSDKPGHGSKSTSPPPLQPPHPTELPFSVKNPPPPLPIVECPMSAFYLYSTSMSILSTLLPGGVPSSLVQATRTDDGPLDCLVGIRTVVIPALVEMMRVWRVAEIYLVRVRQLFDEVQSYLESRMPAFAKRFSDIYVETSVPDLKSYMVEFNTFKRRPNLVPRTTADGQPSPPEEDMNVISEETQERAENGGGGEGSPKAVDALADILSTF
ncbi:hypothetical protein HDU97_003300 [Phlyctochytrium planicorne]|nr:hypothetical protein HDU97_003300 [Phlyctochytrium planicorne]